MTVLMIVVASSFSLALTVRGSQNSAVVAQRECPDNSVFWKTWAAQGTDMECVVWFCLVVRGCDYVWGMHVKARDEPLVSILGSCPCFLSQSLSL